MASTPWHAAMTRLAHAYLRHCDEQGITEDGWAFDALVAAGDQRTYPVRAGSPPAPAATREEHDARRRAVEATVEAARARGVTLPDHVTVRLLAWIHDLAGWNA